MYRVDRRKNRSDTYQQMFTELPHSNEMMAEFSESQGLVENYTHEDRERLLDLRIALKCEMWRLIDTELTARQRQVIRLYAKGYTQIEIAKQLNVNQSSITKSINGNCDYRNGKKIYGGARKKLRRLADRDPEIQDIIGRIAEIHAEYR